MVLRTARELLGRETELDAVRALLARSPVVTVTGVGGVGKTRLVQAVAASEVVRPVVMCDLGAVDEPAAVEFAVADALGFPSLDAALIGLGEAIRVLLVDNCEHLLDAAADAVSRLVDRCHGVCVLATSREALGIAGEHVLPLGPLALPASGATAEDAMRSPAVRLLLERAAAAGADVDLVADPEAVVALCRRLDGLPLAIELAAARLRSLTPREVLGHLDDRLDLLSRGRDRGPERHRSLEAAIDWSYERLSDPAKRVFERLSVFSGRFTAQHAQAVAGEPGDDLLATVEQLDQLVAQSLVTVRRQGSRSWYGMLRTLRGYARERLAERGELQRVEGRWVDSFVGTAVDVRDRMLRAWPVDLMITLQNTHLDVADALRWCVAHDDVPDRARPLFIPLCGLLKSRRAMPIAELGDLVLDRWPEPRHETWAEVAAAASVAHVLRGSGERGVALARQAIDGTSSGLAAVNARRALYFHERRAGRHEVSLRWIDEAIDIAVAHDMTPWHNELLTFRALALASLGRVEEAIDQAGAAHRIASGIGSPALEAWAVAIQGSLIALRDPVAGRAMCAHAAQYCEEIDYPIGAGISLRTLGALAALAGDFPRSAEYLSRALDAFLGFGYVSETALTLRWIARLTHLTGRERAAATLWHSTGSERGDIVDDVLGPPEVDTRLTATDAPPLPLSAAVARARAELAAITSGSAAAGPADAGRVSRTEPTPPERARNVFRLEGSVWTAAFDGVTVRLPDAKGLHDLSVLLSRPGREVHCTELMGAAVEQSDTGPVIDSQARREYEARIVELQADLKEAEEFGDTGRVEAARTEMEFLLAELTAATGLGGRDRRGGGNADRARSAVTQRIRAVLRRLDALHPALARHLRAAVSTGTWCAYRPDAPVRWGT
ncbi:ATP-binding protein [Streptomyces sp. NPDC006365]|uniref:ATP-binding protein n=1 Tax=Streptomyces sp. NPDC006365 TaxID=3364744 RepID=UPI0036C8CD6A